MGFMVLYYTWVMQNFVHQPYGLVRFEGHSDIARKIISTLTGVRTKSIVALCLTQFAKSYDSLSGVLDVACVLELTNQGYLVLCSSLKGRL